MENWMQSMTLLYRIHTVVIFMAARNDKFSERKKLIFFSSQSIDCWYSLELPH